MLNASPEEYLGIARVYQGNYSERAKYSKQCSNEIMYVWVKIAQHDVPPAASQFDLFITLVFSVLLLLFLSLFRSWSHF